MARKKATTRRGNNEGSIYKRGDGKWVSSVTVGYNDEGERIRKNYYGNTRSEVVLKMTAATNSNLKINGSLIMNDCFEVLMHEWLITFKRPTVSSRTFERNLGAARLNIYPNLGQLKISEITTPIIQRLLNNLHLENYCLDTIKKTKFLLSQFFEYAVDSKFVDVNPVSKVKVLSRERKIISDSEEYKAIPIEVRQTFLNVLKKSEILEPICLMSMFAGLRIGEVLALKWKNLDLVNKTVTIDNAITIIPKFDKSGKVVSRETVISDTKTAASMREVPLPDILVNALKKWQTARFVKQCEKNIPFLTPNELVFSNNEGKLRTYYGTRTMFDRLMKSNDLAKYKFHFHTLRHTYSSMLFEANENPKVIQMLLGHKEVTTTIKTYNSVDRSYFRQATNKLNEKYKSPELEL